MFLVSISPPLDISKNCHSIFSHPPTMYFIISCYFLWFLLLITHPLSHTQYASTHLDSTKVEILYEVLLHSDSSSSNPSNQIHSSICSAHHPNLILRITFIPSCHLTRILPTSCSPSLKSSFIFMSPSFAYLHLPYRILHWTQSHCIRRRTRLNTYSYILKKLS